jgi:tripartite-type tricarboxylate transporter receptor subunit TctC
MTIVALATGLPQVEGGKLRAPGVTHPKALAMVPGVPAIADTPPGGEFGFRNALHAPAGTPEPVVRRLNESMKRAPGTLSMRQAVEQAGMQQVKLSTLEPLAAFPLARQDRWGVIVERAGIAPQ